MAPISKLPKVADDVVQDGETSREPVARLELPVSADKANFQSETRPCRRLGSLNSWQFRLLTITFTFALFVVVAAELIYNDEPPLSQSAITHIASLGSSFAAGPGIPPQVNHYAGRSGNNYGALLAARLDIDYTDLAVSGATLLNLISQPQRVSASQTFAPQVDDLPPDADLVLVLGGGNDLGYVGGLMQDHGSGARIRDLLDSAEALGLRYGHVLDAIHDTAPDAVVIVVEYLTLLGSDFRPGVHAPFNRRRAEFHRGVAEMLHNGTMLALEGREDWCHVVEVAQLSEGHGIGAKQAWVGDYRGMSVAAGVPYHPNIVGMQAVERMLFHKIVELGLVDPAEL